jgi:hypothetical protein
MVHHIRFLKAPRVVKVTSHSVSVNALITLTTDLGDTFLHSDMELMARLVVSNDPHQSLCSQSLSWHKGYRELSINQTAPLLPNASSLRLHVHHPYETTWLPRILDVWSAPFEPVAGSRAEALVERQFSIPHLPLLRIWEETGNSIARHIW